VQNITSVSLEVECVEGFDNGMPQMFHADIVDAGNSRLLSNVTSPIPYFLVNGLRAGQAVKLFVYAANRKGSSERVILETQTMQEAEMRTGEIFTEDSHFSAQQHRQDSVLKHPIIDSFAISFMPVITKNG
jgi:hypothetical protein